MTQPQPPFQGQPGFPGPAGPQGMSHPSGDPEAQGLPSDVTLPDAARFKRDQIFARLIVCLIGLAILSWITWMSQQHRWLYLICTLAVLVTTAIMGVRYLLARKAVSASSSKLP